MRFRVRTDGTPRSSFEGRPGFESVAKAEVALVGMLVQGVRLSSEEAPAIFHISRGGLVYEPYASKDKWVGGRPAIYPVGRHGFAAFPSGEGAQKAVEHYKRIAELGSYALKSLEEVCVADARTSEIHRRVPGRKDMGISFWNDRELNEYEAVADLREEINRAYHHFIIDIRAIIDNIFGMVEAAYSLNLADYVDNRKPQKERELLASIHAKSLVGQALRAKGHIGLEGILGSLQASDAVKANTLLSNKALHGVPRHIITDVFMSGVPVKDGSSTVIYRHSQNSEQDVANVRASMVNLFGYVMENTKLVLGYFAQHRDGLAGS